MLDVIQLIDLYEKFIKPSESYLKIANVISYLEELKSSPDHYGYHF